MWAIWRLYGIITHMFRQDEYDIPCAIWRLWLPVAALVAILAGCATIPKLDTANPAEEIRRFYVEEVGDPNCSVAIVHDGHIVYAGDEHAIYRIGSLTKLFVAELAERMAVKGEIDLDAPVTRCSKYALAPAYGSVTLRDLMTHRSGLPIDFLNPWNPLDWHVALMCGLTGSSLYGAFNSQEDFVKYANSSRTLRFLAAREPAYSNVGFALLPLRWKMPPAKASATCFAPESPSQWGLTILRSCLPPNKRNVSCGQARENFHGCIAEGVRFRSMNLVERSLGWGGSIPPQRTAPSSSLPAILQDRDG